MYYFFPIYLVIVLIAIVEWLQFMPLVIQDVVLKHGTHMAAAKQNILMVIWGVLPLAAIVYSNVLTSSTLDIAQRWRHLRGKKQPKIIRETGTCVMTPCSSVNSKYVLEIDGKRIHLCKTHLAERLETDQRVLAAAVTHILAKEYLSDDIQGDI
jgi:hypothetical protein